MRESVTRGEATGGLEPIFLAHYGRVARTIARVVRDEARAEEIAVEVFLQFWQTQPAAMETPEAWLLRVAVRRGLNELRSQQRRRKYEQWVQWVRAGPTPEQERQANEEQAQVREILSRLKPREAELLLLRNEGLSYEELAVAMEVSANSIGTMLRRAQMQFRKEYEKRYGTARDESGKRLGGE